MKLTAEECDLFYDLYSALLGFANRKLGVSSEQFSNSRQYLAISLDARVEIRDALFRQRDLIDEFVEENPAGLDEDQLRIVSRWKAAIAETFYVFRYLKNYTVFLVTGDRPVAYGVVGLVDPLPNLLGPRLPRMVSTVLLPFRGKIVYDGLMSGFGLSFGGNIKKLFNESYRRAKAARGIITSLEGDELPTSSTSPKKKQRRLKKTRPAVRSSSGTITDAINDLTDDFCARYLDKEYGRLCRKLASELAERQPSLLRRGRPQSWAAGVVRAILRVNSARKLSVGSRVNFSFVDTMFHVSSATGSAKLKQIWTLLEMRPGDPEWTWAPHDATPPHEPPIPGGAQEQPVDSPSAERVRRRLEAAGYVPGDEPYNGMLPEGVADVATLIREGLDPTHAAYVFVQNITSHFASLVSGHPDMAQWSGAVAEAEDKYMPGGPPMSPLTGSYFWTWALYDLQIGDTKDTLALCQIALNDIVQMNSHQLKAARYMAHSRMGIYERIGAVGSHVRLRELVTGDEYVVHCPTGYCGPRGDLWYVRLLPPLEPQSASYWIAFTTPYILPGKSRSDWVDYLKRAMVETDGPDERTRLYNLLKFGPDPHHWHEFVFLGYVNYQHDAVFLTGIPDIRASLPHA